MTDMTLPNVCQQIHDPTNRENTPLSAGPGAGPRALWTASAARYRKASAAPPVLARTGRAPAAGCDAVCSVQSVQRHQRPQPTVDLAVGRFARRLPAGSQAGASRDRSAACLRPATPDLHRLQHSDHSDHSAHSQRPSSRLATCCSAADATPSLGSHAPIAAQHELEGPFNQHEPSQRPALSSCTQRSATQRSATWARAAARSFARRSTAETVSRITVSMKPRKRCPLSAIMPTLDAGIVNLRGQAHTLVVGEPLRRGSPVARARGQAWLRRGASWQGRTCASTEARLSPARTEGQR